MFAKLDVMLKIYNIMCESYNMEFQEMSFREKMHWASLVAILLGFGFYFGTLHGAL